MLVRKSSVNLFYLNLTPIKNFLNLSKHLTSNSNRISVNFNFMPKFDNLIKWANEMAHFAA